MTDTGKPNIFLPLNSPELMMLIGESVFDTLQLFITKFDKNFDAFKKLNIQKTSSVRAALFTSLIFASKSYYIKQLLLNLVKFDPSGYRSLGISSFAFISPYIFF